MSPTVRPATEGDAAGIHAVTYRAWQAAYDGVLSASVLDAMTPPSEGTPSEQSAWLRTLVEAPDLSALVAEEDGTVLGFAELLRGETYTRPFVAADEAELGAIYVDPDRWHEGVGTRLLERGLADLPADVAACKLGVLTHNEPAKAFYGARGFERVGGATIEIGGERYVEDVYARPL